MGEINKEQRDRLKNSFFMVVVLLSLKIFKIKEKVFKALIVYNY